LQLPFPAGFSFSPPKGTGIYNAWADAWKRGHQMGPAISFEYLSHKEDGTPITVQEFAHARCEDTQGIHVWFGPNGIVLTN
jgi:hypothetical protein